MINRIKIEITGKYTNYFFKELIRRKINIYDLAKSHNKLEIIIDYKDYKNVRKIKTTSKVKIINRYGVSKLKYLFNKYRLLLFFFLFAIFINIFLSHIIFKVEVINHNKKLVKEIKDELMDLGIKKYNFVLSANKVNNIKEKLLENKDIEWLEIERIGTKYVIKVEERKVKAKEDECFPRNIVSKKNAVITKINVENGEIIKKKNDYVVAGETIVSGLIHNKETVKTKVCAKGLIYGKTWYKVRLSLENTTLNTVYTSNEKTGFFIKMLNKEYKLGNKFSKYKIKKYNIVGSKLVPMEISLSKYLEINRYEQQLSKKEIKKKALILAEKKVREGLKKDEHILDKKILKNTINNSKIDIEVFIVAEENITSYFDISGINIDELNKKEE